MEEVQHGARVRRTLGKARASAGWRARIRAGPRGAKTLLLAAVVAAWAGDAVLALTCGSGSSPTVSSNLASECPDGEACLVWPNPSTSGLNRPACPSRVRPCCGVACVCEALLTRVGDGLNCDSGPRQQIRETRDQAVRLQKATTGECSSHPPRPRWRFRRYVRGKVWRLSTSCCCLFPSLQRTMMFSRLNSIASHAHLTFRNPTSRETGECTWTTREETPWWRVDLGATSEISEVVPVTLML